MPYYKEIAFCGNVIEVSNIHSLREIGKKIPRGSNKAATPDDVKEVNKRNAITKLRRLINLNFKYQDIHLVLTYRRSSRPITPEDAKKDLEEFLRKLRAYFKKRSLELKYVAVTEYKNAAIHHHLIINSMDTRDLTELWPHGQPRPTYLDKTGQYGQLASYLIKETSKTFNGPGRVHGKRWCASKNMKQPKIVKRIVPANTWRKDPKPLKGYYIEDDSVVTGRSKHTGYPYQYYRIIKIPGSEGEAE